MKRTLIILILAFTFNFISPGNAVMSQRMRHVIEYTLEKNTRMENENDMIMKKVTLFLRLALIQMKIERINNYYSVFENTS